MKILIEGYQYQEAEVASILRGIEPISKDGRTAVNYVGYFYSKEIADCIFFLPKVLMDEQGGILFHKDLTPEKILDLDTALRNQWIDTDGHRFLSNFAVWIFRTVKEYLRHNPDSGILLHKSFSLIDRSLNETDATLLDIILSLIRFYNENRDFLLYTIKNIHSGYNKINWIKTISKGHAALQRGVPVYMDLVNKKKRADFDEELLVIFFSILSHVNATYGFNIAINCNYELIAGARFSNYLAGFGTIRLRQIKYRYFSDRAIAMWRLCYAFFEAAERINSSSQKCDYLLAQNFNIVFEAIIDDLIGDSKSEIDQSLKDQPDGKVVDHIFHYTSLANDSDIYYIGDSKYYKIGGSLGGNSIYKQYTYAKNVIQFNIDWFFQGRNHIRYRDELTEGYNITPNFFISAEVPASLSYSDANLRQRNYEKDRKQIYQFKNRLFDRDTLWLSHYDINFLYVIALYARSNNFEKAAFKRNVHKEFRQKISEMLNSEYDFAVLEPCNGYSLQQTVDINFKLLNGKIFRPYDDRDFVILSLEKKFADDNTALLHAIRPYFNIYHGYKLGDDVDALLHAAHSRNRTYYQDEDSSHLLAAEPETAYGTK